MWKNEIVDKILTEKRVYIYGAGKMGKCLCKFLSSQFEIQTVGFLDKNEKLYDSLIVNDIVCYAFKSGNIDRTISIIVSVSDKYRDEIINSFTENNVFNYIFLSDLLTSDRFLSEWVGNELVECEIGDTQNDNVAVQLGRNERVAVYTCITANYDELKQPHAIETNCDYYCISDIEPDHLGVYKWIDLHDIVEARCLSAKDANRYCKIHGYELFDEYRYTIYLDGSVTILNGISSMISEIGNSGLALYRHENRECIYTEGITVALLERADIASLREQLFEYSKAGFRLKYGLFAGGVIVTDNYNSGVKTVLDIWWHEYKKFKTRDQISLMYSIWKSNIPMESIGILGGGVSRLEDPRIKWEKHVIV